MKNFLYACCALLGLMSLTNCTKEHVAETDKEQTQENSELTATIEDVTTKTHLDGAKVTWEKGDQIAIQRSIEHIYNTTTLPGQKDQYKTTFGVYNLADAAADSNIGKFNFDSSNENSKEMISGDEEFFAFYPASFCSVHKDNGYFYFTFPQTQKYEDVMGDKFPLPMYGVGINKKIEFKYAGSVIKLRVWASKKDTELASSKGNGTVINSCEVVVDGGFSNKAFTYIDKGGKWAGLNSASNVGHFKLEMEKPIPLSNDPNNPTELKIVLPLAGTTTFKNLKFSINCTKNGKHAGCELVKKSDLKIECGKIVSFPVTELTLDYTRMYIDGELEGELDFDVIKKAKKSVKITMPGGKKLDKDTFRQIIEATRNLENVDNVESIESLGNSENSNRQITIDLSETTADFNTIEGLNGNTYEGFCGGQTKDSGIKNISELRLPKGILQINNMAFSNSDYKKIVLPATLTKIAGMPASGCDYLTWEVADGNKVFWTDGKGALYGNIEVTNKDNTKSTFKTLVALNGGSGETYSIQEGTEKIGSWCMYDNSVLTTLVLPKSINNIGADGLSSTPSLTTIIVYGAPVFNKNSGNNNVGKKGELKTLYVADKYHQQYMDKLKENPNWSKNNWQVLKLSEYKGTIPAENPAKETKTN